MGAADCGRGMSVARIIRLYHGQMEPVIPSRVSQGEDQYYCGGNGLRLITVVSAIGAPIVQ